MSSSELQKAWAEGYLSAGSMAYVDSLYEDYLDNPNSVPADWSGFFAGLKPVNGHKLDISHKHIQDELIAASLRPRVMTTQAADSKQYQVANLINAYRAYGHHRANLDPLGLLKKQDIPNLNLAYHELGEADMNNNYHAGTYINGHQLPLRDIVQALEETYCSSIGIEYMHISDNAEREWIQARMETSRGKLALSADEKKQLLKELIAADGLERYLGTRFVGQKRFGLEGGDALIPMMKELTRLSGSQNVKDVVIGMAHRGRLNVLVNVLGKAPEKLFAEFEGKVASNRSGDVKYHMGFSSDVLTQTGEPIHLALAFNPSHLEIIAPVVEGSVRSRLRRRHNLAEKNEVLPVVIHGDAAFTGQGVVMETFNFSQARGYCTGGTVHIVINNQVGFTTSNPQDSRSTHYCTDIAKMVQAPVIHINGDDPEAVLFATRLAFDYRMQFKRDVVIDLVCYRRHGHNEADEPAITQPVMYQKIKTMRPLRELYAEKLQAQGLVSAAEVEQQVEGYRKRLDEGMPVVDTVDGKYPGKISNDWDKFWDTKWDTAVKTTISDKELKALSDDLQRLPTDFQLHSVVARLMQERQKMAEGSIPMNWGFAETMAFASLLHDGYSIRLSGQDSGRGTFAHRHAVLHDAKTGMAYIPLSEIAKAHKQDFDVIDSVLSEEAVLAFEYGYASSEPDSLVIWEAQFGDFANGAQVVIDHFISSGEQKWGRLCGLVMLLPHGYEGQGPEHSSARLERFMQLCAEQNIQVATPTTPAQIFHLLRRQMIRNYRKPLVIMSPKSLLRHKLAVSELSDLTKGEFQSIIPEMDTLDPKDVRQVVLCCGKVYYDLLQKRRDEGRHDVAIVRVEQLFPFPKTLLKEVLKGYPNAKQVVWCQEEPQNQGVWFSSQHHMLECLGKGQTLRYAGRGFAAAPAVGSPLLHAKQQEALVADALSLSNS